MPSLIPDFASLERRLAGLPVVKHRAREVVLTAGSKTGGLLFLRSGTERSSRMECRSPA
jgi:hypothetical protein